MTKLLFPAERVVEYLMKERVLRTDELMSMVGCAHRTLFEKLKICEYQSSCNHNGRYLTLKSTPKYNEMGLWEYRGAVFSKFGNLTETIIHMVDHSQSGLTPTEFKSYLKTTVTPQLIRCLKNKRLVRIREGRNQVYYSVDGTTRKAQITARRELLAPKQLLRTSAPLSKENIIRVLLTVIKYHETSIKKVHSLLLLEGLSLSEKSIEWVFNKYNIKKNEFL